jgi:hypothetical protein
MSRKVNMGIESSIVLNVLFCCGKRSRHTKSGEDARLRGTEKSQKEQCGLIKGAIGLSPLNEGEPMVQPQNL